MAAAFGAVVSLALPRPALATDLLQAWQGAVRNDREIDVANAAHATAQPQRDQASALWRPNVGLTAAVGVGRSQTAATGAQFSAPGLGTSSGVGFDTSINHGTAGRWALQAVQPLYDPARRARQQQLSLTADLADLQWQAAQQALMLRTAERYFDLALAQETLRVLQRQSEAVARAAAEAQDRFKLGSAPITDTHEAQARLAAIRAQLLAAQTELEIRRERLADSTALPPATLVAELPAAVPVRPPPRSLQAWRTDAEAGNPGLRMQQLKVEIARRQASEFSPRAATQVALVAQAGRDRLAGSGDFGTAGNGASHAMIGIQVSIPLYSGGLRDARHEEAQRQADQAQAEADRLRQQVGQQVRATWLGLAVGGQRVQALEDALHASAERVDATQLGHEVGQRTTLDLLNAENDRAAARLALAQARVGLLLDRLRLAALAGRLDVGTLRAVDAELERESDPPGR
ncbi:MAG: TolC family outer membrane protein [Burkholderiales bacterium]|nr:TolC family outer membrane protein [Burkholderiales bacterium]